MPGPRTTAGPRPCPPPKVRQDVPETASTFATITYHRDILSFFLWAFRLVNICGEFGKNNAGIGVVVNHPDAVPLGTLEKMGGGESRWLEETD